MSFKAGIPLLTTLDDEEDASDEDFSVEVSTETRYKWGRKQRICFVSLLGLVLLLLVAAIVSVTVPLVVLRGGGDKGGSGGSPSQAVNNTTETLTVSQFWIHNLPYCLHY